MRRTALINVVGLTESILGPSTPRLNAFRAKGRLAHILPALPAVTCTAQSTYLTGRTPAEHGCVANGWYDRELAEHQFWKQSNHVVHGPKLWEREPDRCCAMRKVAPLQQALEGMDAWITGIRREQSTTRENARKIEIDARRGIVRVQPLVDWTNRDVWRYIWKHSIPYNTLHDHGFPSIGCVPCTNPIEEGSEERSGRWKGTGKVECGLHGP